MLENKMTITSPTTVQRLPLYLRTVAQVAATGQELVSSEELGRISGVSPALIRKDLSLFGGFGKQGTGYGIRGLRDALTRILHLDANWEVALVGVGRLGRALLEDPALGGRGFSIVALFDNNPALVGQTVNGLVVQKASAIVECLRQRAIRIAILAVPAEAAQPVADQLAQASVTGILNYAPVSVSVPDQIVVRSVDPVSHLQQITFYMRPQRAKPKLAEKH